MAVALGLVRRLLPAWACGSFARVGEIYYRVCPARRNCVELNLLRLVGHDARLARRQGAGALPAFAPSWPNLWRFETVSHESMLTAARTGTFWRRHMPEKGGAAAHAAPRQLGVGRGAARRRG